MIDYLWILRVFSIKYERILNLLGNRLQTKRLHSIMYVKIISMNRILLMHDPFHIRRKSV